MLFNPKKPLILAAMAGWTDLQFSQRFFNSVGAISIGGYSVGRKAAEASQLITRRDRKGFLFPCLRTFIHSLENDWKKFQPSAPTILNLRISSARAFRKFCDKLTLIPRPIIEINIHCQQVEMIKAGTGEELLKQPSFVMELLDIAHNYGYSTGLKLRLIPKNLEDIITLIQKGDAIKPLFYHLDAYIPGKTGCALNLIKEIRELTKSFLIANNSIRNSIDVQRALEVADAISIGREALSNPNIFNEIQKQLI